MTEQPSTIERLLQLREQYKQEGKLGSPSGFDERVIRFRPEDRLFSYMLWDGLQEQGKTFRWYLAHPYPATGAQKFGEDKPCLTEILGANAKCPGCDAGLKTKPRFVMWVYAYICLHQQLKEGELGKYPVQQYGGASGYMETINQPRIWDTSAWKDSPFDDIIAQAAQLVSQGKTLHSLMFMTLASGAGKDRRYKAIPVIGSEGLTREQVDEMTRGLEPVDDWLVKRVTPLSAATAAGATTFVPAPGGGYVAAPAVPTAAPPPLALPSVSAPAPAAAVPPLALPSMTAPAPAPVVTAPEDVSESEDAAPAAPIGLPPVPAAPKGKGLY